MRSVALDVHLDFCEVAIVEDGELHSAGRIETKPEQIELFAGSLGPDDRVALEVSGNAWEIARLIEPHVAQVLVVSPSDTGIRQARAKTDRLDARTLARLLAAGSLDGVWMPDRQTWVMRRRLSRRSQLAGVGGAQASVAQRGPARAAERDALPAGGQRGPAHCRRAPAKASTAQPDARMAPLRW
jgi:Transposase